MKPKLHLSWIISLLILLFLSSCENDHLTDYSPVEDEKYVVLAWNDVGMHRLNKRYDQSVFSAPHNTVLAQVIERGNPPRVVTAGMDVRFRIINNSSSSDKGRFGQFWDHGVALFGFLFGLTELPADVGLTGTGLAGSMVPNDDHFEANGIPVTPLDDDLEWNPYQVAAIEVYDAQQMLVASTQAVVPVSDEMNCAKCHGEDYGNNILTAHDEKIGTPLMYMKPVSCGMCHSSSSLGEGCPNGCPNSLSEAIHRSHENKGASCYDCHPGMLTKGSRSMEHTSDDGNCIACHGSMAQVSESIEAGRLPWMDEPDCATCHGDLPEMVTGDFLYKNSKGHGSIYCTACHGSPHAMYPSNVAADNHQPIQYNGAGKPIKTIGSCGVCHQNTRGIENGMEAFMEKHGSKNPKQTTSCHVCHTIVPANTDGWPHAYRWKNNN